MPLKKFQLEVAKILAANRSEDSHLAGGAALHFSPNSIRYSQDLDYFHDSEKRVASAFASDRDLLAVNKISCLIEMNQPGYIRCIAQRKAEQTKIEWAQDSSWRFMPIEKHNELGYVLSPIDLAINKLLALVGRDEPRDYLDVHDTHQKILPLGAQVWAACGKDPGFNPISLLELLRRRGKYHPEDFARLELVEPAKVEALKKQWLEMLLRAEAFVRSAPPEDIGCLFFSSKLQKFIEPESFSYGPTLSPHFGKPYGILPKLYTSPQ